MTRQFAEKLSVNKHAEEDIIHQASWLAYAITAAHLFPYTQEAIQRVKSLLLEVKVESWPDEENKDVGTPPRTLTFITRVVRETGNEEVLRVALVKGEEV